MFPSSNDHREPFVRLLQFLPYFSPVSARTDTDLYSFSGGLYGIAATRITTRNEPLGGKGKRRVLNTLPTLRIRLAETLGTTQSQTTRSPQPSVPRCRLGAAGSSRSHRPSQGAQQLPSLLPFPSLGPSVPLHATKIVTFKLFVYVGGKKGPKSDFSPPVNHTTWRSHFPCCSSAASLYTPRSDKCTCSRKPQRRDKPRSLRRDFLSQVKPGVFTLAANPNHF